MARHRVEMIDPGEPESKQPYHTAEGMALPQASRLLAALRGDGRPPGVRSDRARRPRSRPRPVTASWASASSIPPAGRAASLEAILASHALIHTADGDHFRNAIAAAAERCGLPATRVRAREPRGRKRPARRAARRQALAEVLRKLGREVGPPWTADQKSAALLAWLVLATRSAKKPARAART